MFSELSTSLLQGFSLVSKTVQNLDHYLKFPLNYRKFLPLRCGEGKIKKNAKYTACCEKTNPHLYHVFIKLFLLTIALLLSSIRLQLECYKIQPCFILTIVSLSTVTFCFGKSIYNVSVLFFCIVSISFLNPLSVMFVLPQR